MNKEIKFSRFVGIAIVIICICIVLLALLSSIMQEKKTDNVIYVETGTGYTLSVAKSNLVIENVNIEKIVEVNKAKVNLKVRLPKINIDTVVTKDINNEMYNIYQDTYSELLNQENIQNITVDYTYEYLENDTILEITIRKETLKDNKTEKQNIIFTYDLKNDKKI